MRATNMANSTRTTPRKSRVTRSISLPPELHGYIVQRAKKERRSFNWIMNDLVEKEIAASAK